MAQELYHAVGKRKRAIARIWMRPGRGLITINNKPMNEYLTRDSDQATIMGPLKLTDTLARYDIAANVRGGGVAGQAGAIRHGISRALVSINPDLRSPLKKAEFLTRDPRIKERKKYGQPGARKRFQYSKR
ncbi:MAG: 30S ribosomal protein S9 [Deltaproteobacteria bacterium]|nr:30S ribosomal protein S9 [Deltaproteobacteria bacterium]